jgi:hypothetical protein
MARTTSGNDICTQALKKAGIVGAGDDPEAEDITDALTDLNDMIDQWRVKRWLMYRLLDLSVVSTGAQKYTIGPGGDMVATVRPDRIESAFIRQITNSVPNQVDYPLQLIEARETYSRLALKRQGSFPQFVWYDPIFPLGEVYPWPLPQANIYELHVQIKMTLDEILQDNIADPLIIPGEYFAAMKFNLARRLRSAYRLPMDKELNDLAADALAVIYGANAQIPRMIMPPELGRGGLYDIQSDQVY